MTATTWNDNGSVWKGVAAGVVGGLVASWVMNLFQAGVKKVQEKVEENGGKPQASEGDQNGGEDATVKTAKKVSRGVFHHELSPEAKKVAGPAVHYAMGAVSGGIYGAVAELAPVTAMGAGLPFGAAVWLAADEVAVPAFGLSKPPNQVPAMVHAQALGSHLVYGLTTDMVRRALLRVL
jgi:putative membrane protein